MSGDSWQKWFEQSWTEREETIYPRLFGPKSRGIFPLTQDLFRNTFKQSSIDPRWLHLGVFEFQPTRDRNSWLYITSGMSNAWEDETPNPSGPSGFGCEFLFETVKPGDWAIIRLQHLMAFQVLLEHNRYPGRAPLGLWDRLPLRTSITFEESELRWLILAPPAVCNSGFDLQSGHVNLLEAFGATDAEAAFARENGTDKLVERLARAKAFPVTDPLRHSVV